MTGSINNLRGSSALIFGVTGQDGWYLSRICSREGVAVYGVSRSGGDGWVKGDVGDRRFVDDVIRELRCDYTFHLAADSTTRHEALFRNVNAIVSGSTNILEASLRHAPNSKVFLAGSALQFESGGELVSVSMPMAASSAYVIARNYASFAAKYYRTLGLRTYVGYFCHHDSPLRRERHLSAKVASTVARIRNGSKEKLEIEYPEVIREFNFAGDVMEAVWMLVNQEDITNCVIGSGHGSSVRDWIELCFRLAALDWHEHVVVTPKGPPPFQRLVADSSMIRSIGWKPVTDIVGLAEMMLDLSEPRRIETEVP